MKSSWEDVVVVYERVAARELGDGSLDVFELGLDSVQILSFATGLRQLGYQVTVESVLQSTSMRELADAIKTSND